jgi:hypothetical protein
MYKRQYYYNFLQPLAEALISNIPKIIPPEHLTKWDNSSVVQIVPVARSNSFEHALLYLIYPKYQGSKWSKKQADAVMLKKFIDVVLKELNVIIVDSESFTDIIVNDDAPCVILYKDDLNIYFPVTINGYMLSGLRCPHDRI